MQGPRQPLGVGRGGCWGAETNGTRCLGGTDEKGQQDSVLSLRRGSSMGHQQGQGARLGAQGPRKGRGAQEMRNSTVQAAERKPRRKEILKCY